MHFNIYNLGNRQKSQSLLSFHGVNIDEIKRKRLIELVNKIGRGGQEKIAKLLNIRPSYLNNILHGRRNLSEGMVEKLCKIYELPLYHFYTENDTPLPSTDLEKRALYITREAERLGAVHVAEESIEFTAHRLEIIKKQKKEDIKEGKTSRLKINSQ